MMGLERVLGVACKLLAAAAATIAAATIAASAATTTTTAATACLVGLIGAVGPLFLFLFLGGSLLFFHISFGLVRSPPFLRMSSIQRTVPAIGGGKWARLYVYAMYRHQVQVACVCR
jgi:hypothetical protein